MKPTTQAKTTNQLVNQLDAMREILESIMAGTKEMGLGNCREKYAEEADDNLDAALLAVRRALRGATAIAVSKNTEEVKAKTRERNNKYKYLREEYFAKKTTNSFSKHKALVSAQIGREALQAERDRKAAAAAAEPS